MNTDFQRDGYQSPISIFSDDEIAGYREQFDAIEREMGKKNASIGVMGKHFEYPFIWEMAIDDRILDAIEGA